MLKIYKLFIFISLITISKLTYSQINVDILTQVDSSFISKDTISICAENVIGLYANVSGGTSPYTYDWYGADSLLMGTSSPFTTFIASNPGTYMIGCLVTDDYGNVCKDSVIIIVKALPDLILSPLNDSICIGDSITLTASGASTILWFDDNDNLIGWGSQIIISPTSNTNYFVVGVQSGCSKTQSINIKVFQPPIVNAGNDTIICSLDSISLHASASNYLNIQWTSNGTGNYTNTNDLNTIYIPSTQDWANGSVILTLTASGYADCPDAHDQLTINFIDVPDLISSTDTTICEGESVTISANGANSFLWSEGSNTSSIIVSPSLNTTYYVTGSIDICQRIDSFIVYVNPAPIFNLGNDTTICYNDSVTIHAPLGFAGYQWNTGDTTNFISVIPTDTTTYTVTVTNEYGCTASDDITINVRPDLGIDAGADQSICEGQSTVLSASGGISYIWSTGETTANITVTPTDTTVYYVTGTDGICNDIDSVIVNVYPNLINLITTPDTQVCMGDAITLEVYGAQTYLWSTGQTDSTIQVIINSDTTYYVTGYAYGCEREDSVVITVGTPITLNISPTDTTVCPGSNVILTVEGATNYLWNTGDTGSSIVVIPYDTTIYSVTGYDSGCTAQISAIVNTYSVDMVTIDSIPPICTGDSAQLIANGTGIIYWSTGDTTNSIWVSPTNDTIYIVNMLDTNGCVTSDTINVVVSLPPNVILNYTSPACMNSYINISAQNATYYSWSTGDSTAEIIIYLEQDTTIYVTATNIYGCSSIDSITIIPDSSAIITHMNDTIVCMHTILGLWANGANTIIWSTGDTGNVINSIITQDTTFYIHSISGTCESYDSIHVQIYPPLYVDAGHDTTVMAGTNAYLHGNVIGGGVSSISWSPSDSMQGSNTLNPIVVVDSSMYFILTVTDTNGCTWMDMVYVNVIPYGIYLESLSDTIICSGDSLILSVNHLFGGTPPYSYEWIIDTNSDTLFGNPITILPTGNSYIYLSVSDSEGYFTYDTMYVSVITTPEPDLPDTLHICYGDTVALDPQTLGSCLWSTGDTSSILEILITQDTLIYLTITNNICSAYDTSLIFMKPLPYIYIYPASDSLCPGDTAVFVVISDGTIQWDNGSINDTLMFEAITNDTIYVTSELNSCYSTAFATTYIYEVPDIILNTNAWNDEVLPGQPLILEILPNTFSYYIVNNSENTFTDTINHFSLYISPGGDLIYVIAVTSEGCESYETIFINSRTIPNGFTPNADNVNDVFMPGVPIKILNRWGQVVYEGDNGWDGTIDNKQAMPGTYFYIIELQDENGKLIKTYKGDLLLIKN
ncbi:MAG: gliding motility-associated C-terminal domain-containing protein [Bacteroidales bacterium]|jgi:gliding motility-associated-like protein